MFLFKVGFNSLIKILSWISSLKLYELLARIEKYSGQTPVLQKNIWSCTYALIHDHKWSYVHTYMITCFFVSLDEESLQTLMMETEAIINSWPLTIETINDGQSPMLISPNNILTMKTKGVMPPPGVFQKPNLSCRGSWWRIQHLSNEFWSRWRKEFIQTLQECQKWVKMSRNFYNGDIVLLKTDLMKQNHWPMCKVIGTNSDDKGVVSKREITSLK